MNFPHLFYLNVGINFLIPFFVLMRNDTKRKIGSMTFVCIAVLFGHWIDYFLMIKPGVMHTTHAIMGHGHSLGEVQEASALLVQHAEEGAEGAHHAASAAMAGVHFPGLLEIGTFLGFAALFVYIVMMNLEKSSLVSYRDPYIDESLNYHVV